MFRSVTFFLQVIGKPLKAATLYSHCSFIMLNTHVFYASNMVVVRRFEMTLTCSMYDFNVHGVSLPSCLACIIISRTLLPEGRTILK